MREEVRTGMINAGLVKIKIMAKIVFGTYVRGLLFLGANLVIVFLLIVLVNPNYLPNLPFLRQPETNSTIIRTEAVQAEVPQTQVAFIVFGDSGTGNIYQQKLAKVILKYPFKFMLHTGDLAYPSATVELLNSNFINQYDQHLKKSAFYPSPGNHDYQADNLRPYLDKFNLPRQALNAQDMERYYSFDYGNAHFVSLDTNTPLDQVSNNRADDMLDWLEFDLKTSQTKLWKIVFFHYPPYSSGNTHGEDLRVQQILVPVLEKYDIDLVFNGHEHNYERTCEIANNSCVPGGVTYVVTGGGGGDLYGFGENKFYTVNRDAKYHFVYAVIDDCQLKGNVIGIDNQLIDSWVINKCEQ